MKFPSYGLVYDYSLEDGGVSRKHGKDDDDEDHHTGEVRGQTWYFKGREHIWQFNERRVGREQGDEETSLS